MQQASPIPINVRDETSSLETVILGIGLSPGPPRGIDKKAEDSIAKGTYPTEQDIIQALDSFESVLQTNKVTVLHPDNINDLNQVFVRDLGFVIDDRFIRSKMALPIREQEQSGKPAEFRGIFCIRQTHLPASATTHFVEGRAIRRM